MAFPPRVSSRIPRWLRHFPLDLAFVLAFVVATNVVTLAPTVSETPLRTALGLTFALFIPGYAFIAMIFPKGGRDTGEDMFGLERGSRQTLEDQTGLAGVERVVLSLAASIIIVPLVAAVLNFTPWGIHLLPVLVSVSALTLLMTVGAFLRRRALPEGDRFRVSYRRWLRTARTRRFSTDSSADAFFSVLFALSLLVAASSALYVVTTPGQSESFTEFSLLVEEPDGELVATNYPQNFTSGEPRSLVMGVRNQETMPQRYSVVIELHRTSTVDDTVRVTETETIGNYEIDRLPRTASWQRTHQVTPTLTGKELRLTYMLYKGDPPAEPTVENAYRELHLWINVNESD